MPCRVSGAETEVGVLAEDPGRGCVSARLHRGYGFSGAPYPG